jgi:flavin reductase (DIM6/NTAB) family NADH-FMN oxidoreductase RutF
MSILYGGSSSGVARNGAPSDWLPLFPRALRLDGWDALAALLSMELDLEGKHADRAYATLCALVTPRPIAWVTTVNADGVVNAAPFSFFNVLGANPPIVGFCPGNREDGTPKDTALNIRSSHEFVVNLVDESVAQAMNVTAATLAFGISELTAAGLTAAASSVVKPPRIAEAPASLECAEWGIIEIGGNRLIIGVVKRVHIRDELFDPDTLRVRSERYEVIGRMASPHWYCHTASRFEMQRPD